MSNRLQESILQAIDNVAQERMKTLSLDKTITATIIQCNNSLTGEHQINYQGGTFAAYSQENKTYSRNTSVYVLVPEGDFSKKKIIIGEATALEDDRNITFVSSLLNDYNTLGRNVLSDSDETFGLHSYLVDDYNLIYQYGDPENSSLSIDIDEFQNYLKEAEAIMIEASFQTRLPREHRNAKTGTYGLQFILAFKDRSTNEETFKTYSYVLDVNNMTGNPYAYTTWVDQYNIFPIDVENFSHIETILFYSHGFVQEDDYVNDTLWGADIWCKNLEIYGLKHISSSNGDYRLKISTPDGATFKSSNPDDALNILATVQYQNTYLTDSTMFYWFAEDARITTSSEDYQMYGGVGWRRLKDKGVKAAISVLELENRAYENKYLCVAVYKETIILKEYFTIYNDTQKHNIGIVSNLGIKFSFDRGAPILTCQIDGKDSNFDSKNAARRPDAWYTFMWSKLDEYGQTFPFNQTKEELQQAYDNGVRESIGYAALSNLKIQIQELDGVEFPKGIQGNQLIYPVKAIDNYATLRCNVYTKDTQNGESYYIGSADITLQNENAANPNDYFIVIENGDQVFQYSESGVSPASERYQDPLKIFPLTAHFYDPAGIEVNAETYDVKWQVPLEDTMLRIPADLTYNPATEKFEWFTASPIYPTDIVDSYNYQALHNQVTCIVTYQGEQYTKDTTFLFVKVGDNGTNGTDVIAKISPTSTSPLLDEDLLTIEVDSKGVAKWNTGQNIAAAALKFDLFQRETKLSLADKTVLWSIAGSTSKNITVNGSTDTAVVNYGGTGKLMNQIVRASTSLRDAKTGDSTTHYAFYSIPIVKYNKSNYKVHIDNEFTLKQVLYNADGRNPMYNKNQGIKIRVEDGTRAISDKLVRLEAIGGIDPDNRELESQQACGFRLILEKNDTDSFSQIDTKLQPDGSCSLYILPNDVYGGMTTNHMVHGRIYETSNTSSMPEAEFWIPIHMSLNTVGLASLNAWDGNRIEINEDENYILAPQIGAGEKDQNNRFTGIVMGKTIGYDNMEEDEANGALSEAIGLQGYSHGERSIFLDAETGKAVFGLPELDKNDNTRLNEGRIELVPGGVSSISRWKIDSRSLYNVGNTNTGQTTGDVSIGNPYTDAPANAKRSIPHFAPGILLNADPAYISVKGRRLLESTDGGSKQLINFDAANTVISEGDTFEVEIDPNNPSIFTVYRHTNTVDSTLYRVMRRSNGSLYVGNTSNNTVYSEAVYKNTTYIDTNITGWRTLVALSTSGNNRDKYLIPERSGKSNWAIRVVTSSNNRVWNNGSIKPSDGVWRREAKVGINAQGRFYTNALKDSTTALNIGNLGAFGIQASMGDYVGASFDIGSNDNTLVKFFTDANTLSSQTGNLYISTATETSSEYARPLSIHGRTLALYANSSNSTSKTTPYNLILNNTEATLKNDSSYLTLRHGSNQNSNLTIDGNLITGISQANTKTVTGANTETYNSIFTETVTGAVNKTWRNAATINVTNNYTLNTGDGDTGFQIKTTNGTTGNMVLGSRGGNASQITLNKSNANSLLTSHYGWNITGNGAGGISILSNGSTNGVIIDARPSNKSTTEGVKLSMLPQNGGSASTWTLSAPLGAIRNIVGGAAQGTSTKLNFVQATPGFATPWLSLTGTINGSNPAVSLAAANSILAPTFYFRDEKTGAVYGTGGYKSRDIWAHLNELYGLIKNIRDNFDTWVQNKMNNYKGTYLNGYATQSWVRNNFASSGHTHNYASATHKHYVAQLMGGKRYAFSSFGIDNPGYYYDADGSGSYSVIDHPSGALYTGRPE